MTTRVLVTLFITIAALCLMFALVRTSRQQYDVKHGFNRTFNPGVRLQLVKSVPVESSLYIAGLSNGNIYFHTSDPYKIFYTDTTLNLLKTIVLPIDTAISPYLTNGFSTAVRYPAVFIFAYNVASILIYNLQDGKQAVVPTPGNYNNAVQISDSAFMLKYFTGDSTDQSFCKLNIFTTQVTKNTQLTEDLSSGGMLLYNEQNAACYYVHNYNNRITIFDTAFNSGRTAHTIDTFTQSQIQYLSKNRTNSDDMLYKPKGGRMLINYLSQLYDGRLYVNSVIKADNETVLTDKNETAIDIYNANMDKYLESFHLPVPHKQHLKSFCIFNRKILATYTNHIALYEFSGLSK
ncbi:hypothetical protein [Chitinophaga sp. S165]|uniref:hypothetical protein n=1 Tax=Chitinophaga sp. S165 TaxID=2135462 RepID=UPI000D71448E|nr:hypothetical protein [Chitinophaga sp. S165]PWV48806.1 hypothetical protein C7475_10650 [Chitinophaga sp. S165]